ncbi:hypothetical protein ABVT39_027120 [Epinephelus coioides]
MGVNAVKSHMLSDSHKSVIKGRQQLTVLNFFAVTSNATSVVATTTATAAAITTTPAAIVTASSLFRLELVFHIVLQAGFVIFEMCK